MRTQATATLLDVITDGFEGIQGALESYGGWRIRQLPCRSVEQAQAKYAEFAGEAARWKGPGTNEVHPPTDTRSAVHVTRFPDLQVLQSDRAVVVLVPDPGFDRWWHKAETWGDADDPGPTDSIMQFIHGEK